MTIALVQAPAATSPGSAVTSISLSFASTPTAGNFCVAMGTIDVASGPTSITIKDNAGTPNTYTQAQASPFTGNASIIVCAFLPNVPSGAGKQITMSWSSTSADGCLFIAEFSGVLTSSPQDGNSATTSGGGPGTTFNTPSKTPSQGGDLFIGVASDISSNITAVGGSWTLTGGSVPSDGNAAEHQVQAGSGNLAINFTSSASSTWDGFIAAFKAVAGAAATQSMLPIIGVGP